MKKIWRELDTGEQEKAKLENCWQKNLVKDLWIRMMKLQFARKCQLGKFSKKKERNISAKLKKKLLRNYANRKELFWLAVEGVLQGRGMLKNCAKTEGGFCF